MRSLVKRSDKEWTNEKARVINWMSKSDSWFPAISADLLVACSTTQHCLVIAQCNCHTVLNITTVKLPHSAVCAACHTQQSFVTNRSTPPSAATALYQAAVSHWFPCFRTTFPTDFIYSMFQIQLSTDFQDGHQAEQEDGGHLKHPQEGWSSSKGEWPDFVLTGKQTHVAPLLTGEQT